MNAVFAGDNISVTKNGNDFFVGFFITEGVKGEEMVRGRGTAYYSNGVTIEGSFENCRPVGDYTIHYCNSKTKETISIRRDSDPTSQARQCLTIEYPSGIVVKGTICFESSSLLFSSIVPYFRNYYFSGYIWMGQPSVFYRITNMGGLNMDKALIRLFLEWFDLQQPCLLLDVLNDGLSHIHDRSVDGSNGKKEYNDGFKNIVNSKEFNLIERITLVCHEYVRQSRFHFILPEIAYLNNINSVVKSSSIAIKGLDEKSKNQYRSNWNMIMKALSFSDHLRAMTVIAYPFDDVTFYNEPFERVRELVIKGIIHFSL